MRTIIAANISDPECPTEEWWRLAAEHPFEAMASPLYPLLTLESPERWVQLERDNLEEWIDDAANRLLYNNQHLFAADCAERALPIYEAQHPNDKRPREAIVARRSYALDEITRREWEAYIDAAADATEMAKHASMAALRAAESNDAHSRALRSLDLTLREKRSLLAAVHAAAKAATGEQARYTARSAADAVAGAATQGALDHANSVGAYVHSLAPFLASRYEERQWQWRKTQEYLREEAT